jgi:hypothetical protein
MACVFTVLHVLLPHPAAVLLLCCCCAADAGLMQWVVDTQQDSGQQTGYPPNNRFELEPNSVRFEFTESHPYGYTESKRDSPRVSMDA